MFIKKSNYKIKRKAFGLIFAIFVLLVISLLSVIILQYKSTKNQLLIKENLYNQATIHLYSTIQLLDKLDLFKNKKEIITVEDKQFNIKISLLYIGKNDTINKQMIRCTINIESKVEGYRDIKVVRVINIFRSASKLKM